MSAACADENQAKPPCCWHPSRDKSRRLLPYHVRKMIPKMEVVVKSRGTESWTPPAFRRPDTDGSANRGAASKAACAGKTHDRCTSGVMRRIVVSGSCSARWRQRRRRTGHAAAAGAYVSQRSKVNPYFDAGMALTFSGRVCTAPGEQRVRPSGRRGLWQYRWRGSGDGPLPLERFR